MTETLVPLLDGREKVNRRIEFGARLTLQETILFRRFAAEFHDHAQGQIPQLRNGQVQQLRIDAGRARARPRVTQGVIPLQVFRQQRAVFLLAKLRTATRTARGDTSAWPAGTAVGSGEAIAMSARFLPLPVRQPPNRHIQNGSTRSMTVAPPKTPSGWPRSSRRPCGDRGDRPCREFADAPHQ